MRSLLLKNMSHQKIYIHFDIVVDVEVYYKPLLNKRSNKSKLFK